MAERERITREEFERLKKLQNEPRKSYAEMTDEEVEERYFELGLPPPSKLPESRW